FAIKYSESATPWRRTPRSRKHPVPRIPYSERCSQVWAHRTQAYVGLTNYYMAVGFSCGRENLAAHMGISPSSTGRFAHRMGLFPHRADRGALAVVWLPLRHRLARTAKV